MDAYELYVKEKTLLETDQPLKKQKQMTDFENEPMEEGLFESYPNVVYQIINSNYNHIDNPFLYGGSR